MFQAYTPEKHKKGLEVAGYEVKTLGRRNYKGILLKKVEAFELLKRGDKYLRCHPGSRSHYGRAYYRTSYGKLRGG